SPIIGWDKVQDDFVSIPNGLHRPFSRRDVSSLLLRYLHVSIPNGLHRPFSPALPGLRSGDDTVSIPNGLHRPFSPKLPVVLQQSGSVSIPNGLHRPFSPRIQRAI